MPESLPYSKVRSDVFIAKNPILYRVSTRPASAGPFLIDITD
jgi:hypothetical protein